MKKNPQTVLFCQHINWSDYERKQSQGKNKGGKTLPDSLVCVALRQQTQEKQKGTTFFLFVDLSD